jgi:hypothetical protein
MSEECNEILEEQGGEVSSGENQATLVQVGEVLDLGEDVHGCYMVCQLTYPESIATCRLINVESGNRWNDDEDNFKANTGNKVGGYWLHPRFKVVRMWKNLLEWAKWKLATEGWKVKNNA